MGTYGVSPKELEGILTDALDNVEGDFDRVTLLTALGRCMTYKPVLYENRKKDDDKPVVHLLCCNDTAQAASMKTEEEAREIMEKMAKSDWEKRYKHGETYEEYRKFRIWHIHTVDLV